MSLVSSLSCSPKGIFCSFFSVCKPLFSLSFLLAHDLASSVAEPSGEGSHQLCQLPPTDMSLYWHSFPSCYEGNNRPCLCHGNFSDYPLSCNMNAFLSPRLFPPAFKQNFFHLKICSLEPITTFSNQPISLLAFAYCRAPQRVVYTLCFKFPLTSL